MTSEIPILSRLIFQVRPDCMVAFEQVFETELAPILKQYGLKPADESGRVTASDILGRLYVHNSISDLLHAKKILQDENSIWRETVKKHLDKLVDIPWEGYDYSWRFDPYVVPAGSGTRIQSDGMTSKVGQGQGHWEHFGIVDGLPSVNVMCMIVDQKGRLWVGTEKGVACLDSYNWRTFTLRDGLPGMAVRSILEDREGYLWFGFSDKGVARFDGTSFEHFDLSQDAMQNTVCHMLQDYEGKIWGATRGSGVCCYDGENWSFYTTRDGLAHNMTNILYEDKKQNLWIGTENGLTKYDRRSKQTPFVSYGVEDGFPNPYINSIVEDQEGYLWFVTKDGVIQAVSPSRSKQDLKLVKMHTIENGLLCNEISCAFADDLGHVWFGTQGQGVVRYNGKMFHKLDSKNGIADNFIKAIHKDPGGHYWFGTGSGISRYSGDTFWSLNTTDGLPNNAVLSLAQGKDTDIWMGTRNGAAYFEGEQFTIFNKDHGLQGNEVRHVMVDSKGQVWFAVYGGLTCFDGEAFTTYTVEDGLPNNEVQFVLEDNEGHIWFVTWQGRTLCRYDGETFTTYTLGDGLPSWKFWTVFQDTQGTFWVGARNGLSRSNASVNGPAFETMTVKDGLVDDEVRAIIEDGQGRLWFSTFGGLSVYDGSGFTSYGTENGLAHHEFRGLLQDRSGDLWFGTYGAGVNRWRPESEMALTQVLTDRDGLIGNCILSILEDRSGYFWFGTSSGVTRFIQPDTQPPQVVIKAVVADRRYQNVSDLSIPTTAEVVAFEFSSISFKTRSETIRYRYRLAGFDDGWQVTRERRVEYNDLPEGHYTFEVDAFDRDLVGSDKPAVVQLTVLLSEDHIAQRLKESTEELLQAVTARNQLDARLQELNYLYVLRTKLSEVKTPHDILHVAGSTIAQALREIGTVTVSLDDQTLTFGENGNSKKFYECAIAWGERTRGSICVSTRVPLSEAQEHMLLEETVDHLIHALETRELEAQLLQSARLISMGQMAAGVAHELNQPLGAISNVVNDVYLRLKDGIALSEEELSQMMQQSMGVIKRMSETINHLRIFSRDEAQAPPEPFDLNTVVESSLTLIGTQLKNHGIGLHLNLDTNLPELLGHAHQIEQVVVNLLSNASDAVDKKESNKRIEVKSFCDKGHIVLEVKDNGEGIAEENLSRVFEPFFTTKEADQGTGLGLSISYAIVKNHGGHIVCESVLGQETVFRVMLPVESDKVS